MRGYFAASSQRTHLLYLMRILLEVVYTTYARHLEVFCDYTILLALEQIFVVTALVDDTGV
jgi:hypothetical protein